MRKKTRPKSRDKPAPAITAITDGAVPAAIPDVSALQDQREGLLVTKYKLQFEIMSGSLILKTVSSRLLGNIFSVYRNQFLCTGDSAGVIIAAKIGIRENDKKYFDVKKIIDDCSYETVGAIRNELVNFIKS